MKSGGVGRKVFQANESMRKKIFKGDIDRNSIFYDLILTPLTPRSIGLKLQFFKDVVSLGVGKDIEKFQNQLNESMVYNSKTPPSIKTTGRNAAAASHINAHINIFYLRDKVVEHRVLHERFEAISVLQS